MNADALRLRAEKSTSSTILAVLQKGTQVSVLDASDPEWVQVKTQSGLVGYMSAEYLTLRYEGDPPETLPTGKITLSHTTASVSQGKTLYLKATGVSTVSWTSSNEAVATVTNGFVEALSPGTVVITASYGSVSASCTVCIGAMAVVGSIRDGVAGDHSVLVAKGVLDAIIICVMAASQGKGSIFSAVPVGLFQGAVTAIAFFAGPFFPQTALDRLSFVGSILIFCVGLNLLRRTQIRAKNRPTATPTRGGICRRSFKAG